MPVDESSIRNHVKSLRDFKRWSNKNELTFLPQLMEEEEKIRGLTSVLYMERKWLFVVTNRKLIFLYRKLVNGFEQTIPISDILSVSCKKGLMFARLTLVTKKDRMILESVLNRDAHRISEIITELLTKM